MALRHMLSRRTEPWHAYTIVIFLKRRMVYHIGTSHLTAHAISKGHSPSLFPQFQPTTPSYIPPSSAERRNGRALFKRIHPDSSPASSDSSATSTQEEVQEGEAKNADMELEFGLQITRPTTDITWESIETAASFVLLIHLSGFSKDDIEISVDKESMKLCISGGGGRYIRDRIISGKVTVCRDLEIARFRKAFPIANVVILEQIEATFDKENGILSVFMPKWSGEVVASGNEIEQVKQDVEEEEEVFMDPDQEEKYKSEAPLLQGSENPQNNENTSEHEQDEMLRPEPDPTESESKNRELEMEETVTSDQREEQAEVEKEEDDSAVGKTKIPESEERDHRNSAADGPDKNPKDLGPDAELDRFKTSDSDKPELGFLEEEAKRSRRGRRRRARGSHYSPLSPYIWEGSVFLLSILVLVINLLRNRRR